MKKKLSLLKKMLLSGLILCAVATGGCITGAELAVVVGAPPTLTGLILWLTSQKWFGTLCYYIGDEGAMVCMANANRTVDQDTIGACAVILSGLQTAEGLPASQVNANLAAAIANLPVAEQGAIQEAAGILDDVLPISTSAVALTSAQINDIVQFVTGWQTGTTTEMNEQPATAQAKLLEARKNIAEKKDRHKDKLLRATPPVKGGWFVPPVPAPLKK